MLAVQTQRLAMNCWCEQLTGLLEAKKAKLRELQAQLDKQHELELGDKVLSSPLFATRALACTHLSSARSFMSAVSMHGALHVAGFCSLN